MIELKREGILFCLCGPAGAGKTTVSHHLIKNNPPCSFSVSVTSRPARAGEVDGRDYHFVSKAEFERRIAAKELFEFEEVHGNYYGTLKSSVLEALKGGVDLLLDIDIKGALTFKNQLPKNTVIVFLVPPSASVLKDRLIARGSISAEDLQRRLTTAESEYKKIIESRDLGVIDYLVVNNELEKTCSVVSAILTSARSSLIRTDLNSLRTLCVI